MAERVPLLFASFFLCGLPALAQTGAQPEPTPASPEPPQQATAPKEPTEEKIGVDEAIRRAIDALDALDAMEQEDQADNLKTLTDQVERFLEIVEETEPANPYLPYLYGRAFAYMGRHADAAQQLRKFIATREGRNDWQAYRLLGDLFVNDYPRLAEANYKQAADLKANEPSVLHGLARCASTRGSTEEAIRFARDAVAADAGRTARYPAHLSVLLQETGQWDEALQHAQRALNVARDDLESKPGARAPLLSVDAQYGLLIDILRARISQRDHQGADDYLRLASYIRERGRITELLILHDVSSTLEAGIARTEPNTPPALYREFAIALVQVGRTDLAVAVFEKLLERIPGDSTATEWLNRLRPSAPTEAVPPEER